MQSADNAHAIQPADVEKRLSTHELEHDQDQIAKMAQEERVEVTEEDVSECFDSLHHNQREV